MNGDPLDELDEAWAEIKRLEAEIARLRLTDAERTAIQRLIEDYEGDGEPASAGVVATLRGLLDRLEPIATGDNDRSQPVKNDARLAALERLVALDQELDELSGSAPLSGARQSPDSEQ